MFPTRRLYNTDVNYNLYRSYTDLYCTREIRLLYTSRTVKHESDAILLSRDFLPYELEPSQRYKLSKIQKWLGAKCQSVKPPLTAAEASVLSCAAVANQAQARVIVIPTVTGSTAKALLRMMPACLVITVSTKPSVTRLLHTFRCIVPLMYKAGASRKSWHENIQARVHFAIEHAVMRGWLMYGDMFVTLQRATEQSSFCDMVRLWPVNIAKKSLVECLDNEEEEEEED